MRGVNGTRCLLVVPWPVCSQAKASATDARQHKFSLKAFRSKRLEEFSCEAAGTSPLSSEDLHQIVHGLVEVRSTLAEES